MTPEELIALADNEAFLAMEAFALGRGQEYLKMRQAEIDAQIKKRLDAATDPPTGNS